MDPQAELESEYWARYDDHAERYAATARDMDDFNASEAAAEKAEFEARCAADPAFALGCALSWAGLEAQRQAQIAANMADDIPF